MILKVLGIACSPRKKGNTTRLLNEALNAVREKGHDVELINLSDLKFSPCQGCGACSVDGKCILKDDIENLRQMLLDVDRIIVSAPIFFMGLNSQTKAMIDRMQPFWAIKYLKHEHIIKDKTRPQRKGLFISAAGTKGKDVFNCAQRSVQVFFNMIEIEYSRDCLYPGIDSAGEIEEHPKAFQEVRNATFALLQ